MSASTIAKIPSDYFEPPATAGTRRRMLRRRIAAIVVAVLVASVAAFGTYEFARHDCRGLAWPDFNMSKVDGECIGWTIERGFAFEPGLRDVTDKIAQLNRDVAEAAGERNITMVRVAVVMPMTAVGGSAMTSPAILHALQGVYVAARRANTSSDFGTPSPLIQLVLMNEGRDQTHWRQITDELASMKSGPHPVVAVVGLGVSIPATQDVADELHTLGIPAIGGVLTASNLSAPGLFQVSPSNDDYVAALAAYVRNRPELKTAVLAFDRNDDYYVQTLRKAFEGKDLETYLSGRATGFIGSLGVRDAASAVFDDVKQNVCLTSADMVFFAGRDRDLSRLVGQLAQRRQCGHSKPIVILTGSTGLNLDAGVADMMNNNQIALVDASSSDAQTWNQQIDAPTGYEPFHRAFEAQFNVSDLADGYAIGHHDAVATAAWAIRRFALQAPDRVPTGLDILDKISNLGDSSHAVPAAGGTLTFDGAAGGWPHGKAVAIIQLPDNSQHVSPFVTP